MTREQRLHKFFNLLRFGYSQGWVVPRSEGGRIIIAENAPDHFQAKLHRFRDLFEEQESAIALGKERA